MHTQSFDDTIETAQNQHVLRWKTTMIRKNGPWIINRTEIKYKNPWIEVREDQVTRPDGKPGIFGVVGMKGGVSVLPLDEQGFVYLTCEFHYAIERESIEVVSGGRDNENEEFLETAKRELKEELGIIAKEWVPLGVVNPFTTVVHSPSHLFLARKLEFQKSEQEGTEIIDLVKVHFNEAVEMVMKSEITHGPSCVLILKTHLCLQDSKNK